MRRPPDVAHVTGGKVGRPAEVVADQSGAATGDRSPFGGAVVLVLAWEAPDGVSGHFPNRQIRGILNPAFYFAPCSRVDLAHAMRQSLGEVHAAIDSARPAPVGGGRSNSGFRFQRV